MRPSRPSKNFIGKLDNFKDPLIAGQLLEKVRLYKDPVTVMEVCGTHTVALFKTGIRSGLPPNINLVSGPGCPVCVTPAQTIETALELSCKKDVVLFCFGDMMKVPGSSDTLESAKAHRGANVRVMYSPLEAVAFAKKEPRKKVVLFGVGFETTIPLFASVLLRAQGEEINNLVLLPAFKLVPPALEAILSREDIRIDGFMLPGHVSAIIGLEAYQPVFGRHHVSGVITGFESVDMLEGLLLLLGMIAGKEDGIKNEYSRFVSRHGNRRAQEMISSVFKPCDAEWRGLGVIKQSGLELKEDFKRFDAKALIDFAVTNVKEPAGCRCADVIMGKCRPTDCALFKSACSPSHPVGPCMVSSEGTCAAYDKYGARS